MKNPPRNTDIILIDADGRKRVGRYASISDVVQGTEYLRSVTALDALRWFELQDFGFAVCDPPVQWFAVEDAFGTDPVMVEREIGRAEG